MTLFYVYLRDWGGGAGKPAAEVMLMPLYAMI